MAGGQVVADRTGRAAQGQESNKDTMSRTQKRLGRARWPLDNALCQWPVYVCVHVCTCVYVCMGVCERAYGWVSVCICMQACLCVHVPMCLSLCTCVSMCKSIYRGVAKVLCVAVWPCLCEMNIYLYISMSVCDSVYGYVYLCVCVCMYVHASAFL